MAGNAAVVVELHSYQWLTIFSIYQQLLWYYLKVLYYIWLI